MNERAYHYLVGYVTSGGQVGRAEFFLRKSITMDDVVRMERDLSGRHSQFPDEKTVLINNVFLFGRIYFDFDAPQGAQRVSLVKLSRDTS